MKRSNLVFALAVFLVFTGIIIAQSSTIVSRLKLDWPDLGYPGGSGLHTKMTTLITKIGDNVDARYEEFSAVADSGVVTHDHNFNVQFSDLTVILYTGVGATKTRVDATTAGYTIAANIADPRNKIDITAPSSGGPHDFTVVVLDGRGDIVTQNKNAVSITGGSISGVDIDGGTASNTSRLTVPKDTKTNLDALTRKEGTLVYATDRAKLFVDDGAQLSEIGGAGGGSGFNLLALQSKNHNFEAGSPPTDWTASGGTFVSETTNPGFGVQSGSWDSNASAQTLKSADVTIDKGLYGRSCLMRIHFKYTGSAGDYVVRVEDSTNVAVTADLDITDSSGKWKTADIGFVCPTSGSIHIALESKVANPGIILLDEAHLGNDFRIGPSNENAELIAVIKQPGQALCTGWAAPSSTTTPGDFSSDTDCIAPTFVLGPKGGAIGNLTDTNLPQIDFSYLPAGIYQVCAVDVKYSGNAGTDYMTQVVDNKGSALTNSSSNYLASTSFQTSTENCLVAEYSSPQTNVTFKLQGAVFNANSLSILNRDNFGEDFYWHIYRYPNQSPSDTVTLETQGWYIKASFSGSSISTGSSNVTDVTLNGSDLVLSLSANSAQADIACLNAASTGGSTCSAVNEALGVSFEAPFTGQYLIEYNFSILHTIGTVAGGRIDQTFKIAQTNNNNDTILQSSTSTFTRSQNESTATKDYGYNITVSDVLDLNHGRNTIKLFYSLKNILSGAIGSSVLVPEGVSLKIIPVTRELPQNIAIANVETGATADCKKGNICSGTYTPTTTNVTCTSLTGAAAPFKYLRIGNVVKVWGIVTANCSLNQSFDISLPIQPINNWANTEQAGGLGHGRSSGDGGGVFQPKVGTKLLTYVSRGGTIASSAFVEFSYHVNN